MKLLLRFFPFLALCAITVAFFYKTFFFGFVPFPGDLLVSEYKPWRTYSYLGYNPGSIPHKAQYPDTIRQIYPWKTLAVNLFKTGELPLWNPYNFSGTPLLANFQSAPLYPLNILYGIFSQLNAWTILVTLQPFLSLLFTYAYIRSLKGSKLASLLGAVSYSFSLYSTVWLQYNSIGHVAAWLPLALLAIESMKKTRVWFAALVASLVSALLAGHPQLAFYLIAFICIYTLVRVRPVLILVLLAILFSLGISAIQILPGLELSMSSARSPHEFDFLFNKILIQPKQLIMLLIPNAFGNPATRTYWPADTFVGKSIYIGLIPLFFLLSAFRLKNTIVNFFGLSTFGILILMTANPVTFILYKLNIPLFSSSSPTLMGFLFTFSLSVMTAFGLDGWSKEKHSLRKLAHRSLTVVAFFILVWITFRFSSHIEVAQKAILYSFFLAGITILGFFIAIMRPKFMYIVLSILIVVHAADLFVQFQKFNPFVASALVFPEAPIFTFLKNRGGIDRFWGYGTANIEANFATQYGLFSPDGYDPLYPKTYGEFIGSSSDGKIHSTFTTQTRSDAVVAPGFGEKDFPSNEYRLRILNILGVKYILDRAENASTDHTFPPNAFREIYNQDGWRVMENRNATPRIFLASDYKVFKTKTEFENTFFGRDFDSKKTILLEQSLPIDLQKPTTPDSLAVEYYAPNYIKVTTKSDGVRLLFLSDTYYPGWKSFVDGKETPIYRANYSFRAILIPKGEHTISFQFAPVTVRVGSIVSLLSLLSLTGLVLLLIKTHHEHKHLSH